MHPPSDSTVLLIFSALRSMRPSLRAQKSMLSGTTPLPELVVVAAAAVPLCFALVCSPYSSPGVISTSPMALSAVASMAWMRFLLGSSPLFLLDNVLGKRFVRTCSSPESPRLHSHLKRSLW